jgi:hypothetical protein
MKSSSTFGYLWSCCHQMVTHRIFSLERVTDLDAVPEVGLS